MVSAHLQSILVSNYDLVIAHILSVLCANRETKFVITHLAH
jgi:hypothetical protein